MLQLIQWLQDDLEVIIYAKCIRGGYTDSLKPKEQNIATISRLLTAALHTR
jgi:hypothetical protein